jgi:outer membrane protein assembly factor BamD (BamD/ComL family)
MRNYIILLGLLALLMTTNPVNSEVTEPEVAYEQGQAAIMSKDWVEAVEAFKRATRERKLRAAVIGRLIHTINSNKRHKPKGCWNV